MSSEVYLLHGMRSVPLQDKCKPEQESWKPKAQQAEQEGAPV